MQFLAKRVLILVLIVLCGSTSCKQDDRIFYGQYKQDAFVYHAFFENKTDGVFVDIGAHDGISLSNTYFFEKNMGWTGLCVEPIPDIFQKLRRNRTCICVEGCIYDKADSARFLEVHDGAEMLSGIIDNYDPRHVQRIGYEVAKFPNRGTEIIVQCYALNTLLERYQLYHIDYLSIDTEGGELDILKSIDFKRFIIDVIEVENNYHDPAFAQFMQSQGYTKIVHHTSPVDEIYVRNAWYYS
jgi:FkbM family methyltransferase